MFNDNQILECSTSRFVAKTNHFWRFQKLKVYLVINLLQMGSQQRNCSIETDCNCFWKTELCRSGDAALSPCKESLTKQKSYASTNMDKIGLL